MRLSTLKEIQFKPEDEIFRRSSIANFVLFFVMSGLTLTVFYMYIKGVFPWLIWASH
jgi:hypothetical protein